MAVERAKGEELLTDEELIKKHLAQPEIKGRIAEARRRLKEGKTGGRSPEKLVNLPRERH